jgi:hypothetical protein
VSSEGPPKSPYVALVAACRKRDSCIPIILKPTSENCVARSILQAEPAPPSPSSRGLSVLTLAEATKRSRRPEGAAPATLAARGTSRGSGESSTCCQKT